MRPRAYGPQGQERSWTAAARLAHPGRHAPTRHRRAPRHLADEAGWRAAPCLDAARSAVPKLFVAGDLNSGTPETNMSSMEADAIETEIHLMRMSVHNYVVRLLDSFRTTTEFNLVLEWERGGTL